MFEGGWLCLESMECRLCQNSFFSVVCDNVTLPESIAVIYPFYHWKSSHESLNTKLFTGIYGKIRYLL